jgi:hypothetical protein
MRGELNPKPDAKAATTIQRLLRLVPIFHWIDDRLKNRVTEPLQIFNQCQAGERGSKRWKVFKDASRGQVVSYDMSDTQKRAPVSNQIPRPYEASC